MLIFSLCLLLFINAMSIGLVFPLFAPLFTQAAEPLFQPGVALSTQSLFYTLILAIPTLFLLIGAPFWGRISDRIGRRYVLLIGLTGVGMSFALSALGIMWGSLAILFFSRALAGFMDGSEAVAQAAIADLSTPQEKARHLGYATFAGTIGFIIGPIVGGFLGEESITGRYHYEIPFVLSWGLTLLNAWLIYRFFPRHTNVNRELHPIERRSYFRLLVQGCAICFDRRIRVYAFLLFILQFTLAVFFQLSSLSLVERFHYSPLQVGVFTTFLGACFSGGIFFVIHVLLKRVAHERLLHMGVLFMLAGILCAWYWQDSARAAWVSVVPLMLGIAMMFNVLLSFISNAVTEHEQGDAMGSGTALKALGWLLASALVGVCYPNVSLISGVQLVLLVIALACSLWVHQSEKALPEVL